MKRVIALTIGAVVVLSSVTACGDDECDKYRNDAKAFHECQNRDLLPGFRG